MENKRNHTYKTKGSVFYITNAINKKHAVESFIQYRIFVAESDIELFEGDIPSTHYSMPAIELKTRELALEWWDTLMHNFKRYELTQKYHKNRKPEDLTDKEIETIWLKEIQDVPEIPEYLKPNSKQFKEFNPELFKAYIDKFSDEDKIKAILILGNSIPTNMISQHLVEDVFPEIGLR